MSKPIREVYSKEVDAVSKICATCKHATPIHSTDDCICKKKGLVSRDFTCKYYFYNHLMKRPPKKRSLSSDKFSIDDFSID